MRVWVLLLPGLLASGSEYTVSSASTLNGLALEPGDTVTWTDGDYSEQTLNLLRDGTEEAPILIRAETPGGVIFQGDTQINIGAAWVVVEGFYFNQSEGTTGVVEFRKSGSQTQFGRHAVMRNCAFNDLQTEGDSKSCWIMIYGEANTVENCSFLNKNSTGACILVELSYQGDTPAGHVIRNNYFYHFPRKDGRTNEGDSEAIRIGESSYQTVEAACQVEGNYFVETDGENEFITNKSRHNFYLHNTFRRCRGALVLRHGSGAWVEGNYFLGEGAADSGGIRISDEGHTIINNCMDDLRGTSYNAALTWMGGNTASGGTSSGYQYVAGVTVAFNTIRDATQSVHMNNLKGSRAPVSSVMANNIISSEQGELITGEENLSLSGVTFEGNILFGSPSGYSSEGILITDPKLSVTGFHPSFLGPAYQAAVGDYPFVTTDAEGRTRPAGTKDIGAIAVFASSSVYHPFQDNEVSETVGASFLTARGLLIPGDLGTWAGYKIWAVNNQAILVDTAYFLGWIWVIGDWVYSLSINNWIYMPEASVGTPGSWGYVLAP